MKKIITGLLAIVLTVGLVSGAAYALFSDTVAVSGIKISTGNADLKVALDKEGGVTYETNFRDSQTFSNALNNYLLGDIYPGYSDWGYFRVKNDSDSDIPLAISAQLTSATNWGNALKDNVQFAIANEDGTSFYGSGYQTLSWWNSSNRNLGISLDQTEEVLLRLYVRIPSSAGNNIADLTLENVVFVLTGTQN